MVWKINKHKRTEKRLSNPTPVLENQPKLKSILKTKNDVQIQRDNSLTDSSKILLEKARETSERSRSSIGIRSNLSIEEVSKGSGNSSLGFTNRRKVASIEQRSVGSRSSWDRESRKSEAAQSTQASERSSIDSRSQVGEVKKRVNFSSIHVRDYERVVGDNPSCTIGPPVGIGWKYNEARVIDIDSFESARMYRKSASHLILSREEREALLLNWGASFHDIVESVRGNLKIKNQRRQTVTNLGKVERIEEAFESATRKLKSALMLRRSTGNKVRRLQEQANLAQSALTSLKIAEDRALSEIRGTVHHIEVEEEPPSEDFGTYPSSSYHSAPLEDAEVRRTHIVVPEEEDQGSKKYSLPGNSTTKSEMEIERFYRELELEMFGEEEMPSMVGQTLEVRMSGERKDDRFMSEDASVNSGMTDKYSVDGLDEELLALEQNRAMIEQGEYDGNQYYYSAQPVQPMHMEQRIQQNHPGWNSMAPSDFQHESHMNGSSEFMQYQPPNIPRNETIPLHAGMTMFNDCALLGDENKKSYRRERRRSSRRKDKNAGPKVQFIPPPTHFSPSHWIDGPDPNAISSRGHDTITISEDIFNDRQPVQQQYYNPYSNRAYPQSFY